MQGVRPSNLERRAEESGNTVHAESITHALKAVCKIKVEPPQGITEPVRQGTGFLVGPRHILTSHDVLRNPLECRRARVKFYLAERNVIRVNLDPDSCFITSPSPQQNSEDKLPAIDLRHLGYTLVALTRRLRPICDHPIPLHIWVGAPPSQVRIIQHPREGAKQITLSGITKVTRRGAQYTTEKHDISPGSPVLAGRGGRLVLYALHHSGNAQLGYQGILSKRIRSSIRSSQLYPRIATWLMGTGGSTDATVTALITACPWLERISCYTGVTDAGLRAIGRGCPQLRKIKLDRMEVTDEGIQALTAGCSQLRRLSFVETRVSDTALNSLARGCTQLRKVWLSKTLATDEGVRAFAACTQLQNLVINERNVKGAGVLAIAEQCKELRHVSLIETQVDSGIIQPMVKRWPHLRRLFLDRLNVLDFALEAIAESCPQLEVIRLCYCDWVTDEGVIALAKGCSNLRGIFLNRTQVTDKGIKTLVSHCLQLEYVGILHCKKVTSEGGKLLPQYRENTGPTQTPPEPPSSCVVS